MESYGVDQPAEVRQQMLERLMEYTPQRRQANILGHCEVARMLATRLGLPNAVVEGIGFAVERWDGTGVPYGVGGEDLPVIVRVMTLINEVEVHYRLGGAEAAVSMVKDRSGTAFEPGLVATFCRDRDALLTLIDRPALWSNVLAAEPEPHRYLEPFALVEAARVMGDFADLKSRFFHGQSGAVAALAVAAAERGGVPIGDRLALKMAALAADLGRVGITTSIWEKPGPLDDAEWEQVRLHPYWSERVLTRRQHDQDLRTARRAAPRTARRDRISPGCAWVGPVDRGASLERRGHIRLLPARSPA
jgi:HD-GYP domain-containing protein (c-di-GMP phosphodiesterase class II)